MAGGFILEISKQVGVAVAHKRTPISGSHQGMWAADRFPDAHVLKLSP